MNINRRFRWLFSPIMALALTLCLALVLRPSQGPSQAPSPDHRQMDRAREQDRITQILHKRAPQLSAKEQWMLALSIQKNAKKYQLDSFLILSIIHVESYYNPQAVSSVNALGLMQIRPFVADEVAKNLQIAKHQKPDLFQIERNILIGTTYFHELLNTFDYDLMLALSAYNHGPTKIQSLLNQGKPIPQKYFHRVLSSYQKLTQNKL